MSMNLVVLLYLLASVCFIQSLKGLSHPTTSIRGNAFGMAGMAIAALTTVALIVKLSGSGFGLSWVLLGLVVGGGYGAWRAKTVEMTKMPELVAFFHSMIGLAAVAIAAAAAAEPAAFGIALPGTTALPGGNRIELALGAFIGALTFTGSVIAWASSAARANSACFRARRWSSRASTRSTPCSAWWRCSSATASSIRNRRWTLASSWPRASCWA